MYRWCINDKCEKGLAEASPFLFGAPEEIRTPDPLVRSQVLYPAELRAREACIIREDDFYASKKFISITQPKVAGSDGYSNNYLKSIAYCHVIHWC